MGILSRFADIMGANINAALSKSESKNADKLLEKYLQDAKDNLGQVKAETAAVIAEEMALARKISENSELCKKYEGYAASALKSQNENDAKKFIAYQMELEAKNEELSKQYENAKQNSEKMRQMTNKLSDDISAAQSKLDEVKQKLAVAKQQENINKFNEKMGSGALGSFDNLLDEVQKRADRAEAAASLNKPDDDIESLAKKYDADSEASAKTATIEERLAKIKAGLQ